MAFALVPIRRVFRRGPAHAQHRVFLCGHLEAHERQPHRCTREDQVVEARVRQFYQGPRVTHFLAFPNTSNVEVATPIPTLESQR